MNENNPLYSIKISNFRFWFSLILKMSENIAKINEENLDFYILSSRDSILFRGMFFFEIFKYFLIE